jgi:hypothetical protein
MRKKKLKKRLKREQKKIQSLEYSIGSLKRQLLQANSDVDTLLENKSFNEINAIKVRRAFVKEGTEQILSGNRNNSGNGILDAIEEKKD